ncbi:MAG: hypothetical protein R3B13_09280 [Polyangiaceae bacterium]
MVRPLAIVVAAIMLTRPQMPVQEAERFARALNKVAKVHDFDPLTGVAIVHFESGWKPEVVSENGEDYGLGQIRARYIGACRKDNDPLDAPSEACRDVKRALLEAEKNLEEMGRLISDNRKLCKAKTGTAWFPQWLASYQGKNHPKQNRWCKPDEGTHKVIRYRQHLIDTLVRKPPKKKSPAKK